MGRYRSKHFKTLLLLQIAAESFQHLSYIFLSMVATKMIGIFEILSLRVLTIFFPKFHIHHCILWRNQKPELSGKRVITEQKGVEFGTHGSTSTYIGHLWPFRVQGHYFGVIRCTCNIL